MVWIMNQEKHRELKHDFLFWANKFVLSCIKDGSRTCVSASSLSYDITSSQKLSSLLGGPKVDVHPYLIGMGGHKVTRIFERILNGLSKKGKLIHDQGLNAYRHATVLEKLAALGQNEGKTSYE
jgi:hypothetical protein